MTPRLGSGVIVCENDVEQQYRYRFALAVRLAFLILFAVFLSPPAVIAQNADLGEMLKVAERYTVKIRATVNWPVPPDTFGTARGTGFIIDKARGWILTNAHVARRSPGIVEVAFTDEDWIEVERVYIDNVLDIAILKVPVPRLPDDATEAQLGCNLPLKQGAGVAAYGHPANLAFTATRGIISSVRIFGYEEYIQLDAQLNPGNSGGPLLDIATAEIVGVNTANMPGMPGLGFATPIRHVCPIISLMTAGKDPTQPHLPVYWVKTGRNETLTIARSFPSTPAGDALPTGATVLGLAGEKPVASFPDLMTALRGRTGNVGVTIRKDGVVSDVSVPLVPSQPVMARRMLTLAGMLIVERNGLDIDYRDEPRLRVEFVKQGEEASRRGILQWDQIETVGGEAFSTVEALHAWLAKRPPTERIALMLRRGTGITPRRIGSEFYRIEVLNSDMKLLAMRD